MIFKRSLAKLIKFIKIMKQPEERRTFLLSKFTFKNFVVVGLLTNVVSTIVLMPFFNETYINLSLSRFVSRMVGKIADTKIPEFMRRHIYESYIRFYNVNQDEILDQDLTNYKTIKDFFIRKINVI